MHYRIFQDELIHIKKACLARALLRSGCVLTKAAKDVGISRRTFQLWLHSFGLKRSDMAGLTDAAADESVPMGTQVRDACELYEEHKIADALIANGQNRSATAQVLGISRRTLLKKVAKYEIRR
jgi:DNA-binding NtrC family response regulator